MFDESIKDKAMLHNEDFLITEMPVNFVEESVMPKHLHWEKYVILTLSNYFETESRVESTIGDYDQERQNKSFEI